MNRTVLETARLRLEPIDDHHFDAVLAMNADPVVMRYITGAAQTPDEARAMIVRIKARWAEWGYGWWALIERDSGQLVGMACLQHFAGDASSQHEIGWRLVQSAWGRGYASEAAQAIVAHAFSVVQAPLVAAVAHPDNAASQKVMRRLGMRPVGLQRHYEQMLATYELSREEWQAQGHLT